MYSYKAESFPKEPILEIFPKRIVAAGKGGSVNEAENLVGRKLGDYTLERKLAVGGMAHIYLGRDAKLERMAAMSGSAIVR